MDIKDSGSSQNQIWLYPIYVSINLLSKNVLIELTIRSI